jgi:hypothetical protein
MNQGKLVFAQLMQHLLLTTFSAVLLVMSSKAIQSKIALLSG